MYMQREFIKVVDSIVMDGMSNKKLYLEVKEKVEDEEIGGLIEDMDKSVLSGEAEDVTELVDGNGCNKMSAAKSLELVTAEETETKSDAQSSEVLTAKQDDPAGIMEEIVKDMKTEKEREKNWIEKMKTKLEEMLKEKKSRG
jgi:23S rRNA maturation-related 3'-5' exoribonuclease YhaM